MDFWLVVVGHECVLRQTTLYGFEMEDNSGKKHAVKAFGIDQITDKTRIVDLNGVRTVFPGAPREVYNRPQGPIDILIGSMFKNIQPYGGEEGFTRGRLRLVKSLFGCGFILTGTHPSISVHENTVTQFARTLVNGASLVTDDDSSVRPVHTPVMSCNRAIATLKIPEFFQAEDLGIAPAFSCKRCSGCQEYSCRCTMTSHEKELVVRRVEDKL